MAMAFRYIAKHSKILFQFYAFINEHFPKNCDCLQTPLQKLTNTFSLHIRESKIFSYIFSYIAIAELKAKHFNESHSHLQPFGYSRTIAEWLKADLFKWPGYGSARLHEKLYSTVSIKRPWSLNFYWPKHFNDRH